MALNAGLTITWFGQATFRVVSPQGKHVIIDPWLAHNPACPEHMKTIEKADLILVSHGHFDHIADCVPLAQQTKAKVIGSWELCNWVASKGVETTSGMNKGGTQEVDGIKVTMVHADHSCGILDNGQIIYGGEAVGYVVEFENGYKVYHAGDTNVFGDMRLIRELYSPHLAMIPIGGHYTMAPREAAYALRLLGTKKVIPMHYATFPILAGTPAQLRELTRDVPGLEIIEMKPGETIT